MKAIKQLNLRHIFVVVLLITMALVPYFVFAQMPEDSEIFKPDNKSGSSGGHTKVFLDILGNSAGYETGESNRIGGIVAVVINALMSILGVIFVAEMVYAGYLWMTAYGNEEQVTKAKSLIRQAIIGLIIIVAAYAIVFFVLNKLLEGGGGGSGGGELKGRSL